MSIRTRIHGYTAWVNMRLVPFEHSLNNVLMDLLRGTNMKYLIESYTGENNDKFQSFENMTKEQLQTRVKWMLKELKDHHIIAEDIQLDTRLFAIRSAKHVFELLWRLVCHDIFFLWERIDFLTTHDENIFISTPFTWVPNSHVSNHKSKSKPNPPEISQLSGFSILSKDTDDFNYKKTPEFDRSELFSATHTIKSIRVPNVEIGRAPDPKQCIVEMINVQLKSVVEGKRITFTKLNELSDTRVLCGLVNSFIPNLFPTEILMNDRWCLNLILRSLDKILMCNSTMDSQDLTEAEPQSLCAFFCYLFMMLFKFRQCRGVINRHKSLEINIRKLQKDLEEKFKLDRGYRHALENKLADLTLEYENLKQKYDIKYYAMWVNKVESIKETVHSTINNKLKLKFDWFVVSEDITVSNLCYNQAINLTLTSGKSFYKLNCKELISKDRKVIIKSNDEKGGSFKFIYDFSNNKNVYKRTLRLGNADPVEIDPENYKNFEIFMECLSNNKILKKDSVFLYQVFPSSLMFYHSFLMSACLDKDMEAIKRLVEFFSGQNSNFIDLREPNSLNTAAHICSSNGYFTILLYLIENFANLNVQNKDGNTSLFLASNAFNRDCAKLLLEFGADINVKNNRGNTILTQPVGNEFKLFLEATILRLSEIRSAAQTGNRQVLEAILNEHLSGQFPLCTLRSRFINGSTLLHTSAYFGHYDLVLRLLNTNDSVDRRPLSPNVKDYKGATALHRTRDVNVMKLLMDFGADVNALDLDGNTPLHMRCYGEKNEPSELEAIQLLVHYKVNFLAKNRKKLLPVHMAAMRGRMDVINLLIEIDNQSTIQYTLSRDSTLGPSPVYYALFNDHLDCANWLIEHGFNFKEKEVDLLLQKILTEEINTKHLSELLTFLCKQGCNLKSIFSNGNTALHYAASLTNGYSGTAIEILVKNGAKVNALNDEGNTPLFMSIQANNPLAASLLLKHNADYQLRNNEGFTAFELIKDIDLWLRCDFFEPEIKSLLQNYDYKQTRNLIKNISYKLNSDFSPNGLLNERNRQIEVYINEHNSMLREIYQIPPMRSKSASSIFRK